MVEREGVVTGRVEGEEEAGEPGAQRWLNLVVVYVTDNKYQWSCFLNGKTMELQLPTLFVRCVCLNRVREVFRSIGTEKQMPETRGDLTATY